MTKRNNFGSLESIYKHFEKNSPAEYILYIVGLILVLNLIYKFFFPTKEGFETKKKLIIKKGENIYDEFYANTYDLVLYNKNRNDFEIDSMKTHAKLTEKSIVLDIGSGVGHHVEDIKKSTDAKAIGIDISPAMISKAKELYPNNDYLQLDARKVSSFPEKTFTHITCFNFTIYYMQNHQQFFENCYKWLKPGGYIVLNVVDKHKFDPVLSSTNKFNLSTSKYVEKCQHNTKLKLVDYDYKSNVEIYPNDITAVFRENFKEIKTGNNRIHELSLFMPSRKELINIAKSLGFIMLAQVDMSTCNANSQYLYVLQKPT